MYWPIFFLLPVLALGATCPACPTNGIWSNWIETAPCPTPCGGCSNTTYTRTCLSSQMTGCPCVGDTTRSMTCGTQACNWPRNNASSMNCCTGTPTTIKNWVHCAPLPDNYTLPCCPDNGYWSDWSGYSKVNGQAAWQRTRSCLSGGYNCPCKGDSVFTTTTCPCQAVDVITDASNTCAGIDAHVTPWSVRKPVFLNSQCQTLIVIEASSFRNDFYTQTVDSKYSGTIGWMNSAKKCTQQNIIYNDITAIGSNGQFYKYYLNCNLNTLFFDGTVEGVAMTGVTAFAQYY
ncbi:unnamed protein product [Caenorhabditis brenneri]